LKVFPDDTANAAEVAISPSIVGHFWLSGNALTVLAANDLAGFSHLRQLFVDGNAVREIEEGAFAHTPLLEFLLLNDNKMRAFPMGLGVLGSLMYLDTSDNLVPALTPEHLAGLTSLRYFNIANNKLVDVQCGTFNQIQSGLNYLNTTNNGAACGIQKYTTVNPMIAGSDATITCACPISTATGVAVPTGALGFCEESATPCEYSPPLLKLTAKAISIDQGWEKISDRLGEWVATTNQHNGQLNAAEELSGDAGREAAAEKDGLSTSATVLMAVLIVCVAAVVGVVILRKNNQFENTGSISDMTSSYASSETTGYRKQLQGHTSQSTVGGGGNELHPMGSDAMQYMGETGHNVKYRRTGKLETYCHSFGADSVSTATDEVVDAGAIDAGGIHHLVDRPSFSAHSAPTLPNEFDGSIQTIENYANGEQAQGQPAQKQGSFYNMFK
jgi:hypothetical protein